MGSGIGTDGPEMVGWDGWKWGLGLVQMDPKWWGEMEWMEMDPKWVWDGWVWLGFGQGRSRGGAVKWAPFVPHVVLWVCPTFRCGTAPHFSAGLPHIGLSAAELTHSSAICYAKLMCFAVKRTAASQLTKAVRTLL